MDTGGRDSKQQEPRSFDLERFLLVVRNRWRLILSCVAVGAATAIALSVAQSKEYTASASLLFRDPGYAHDLFGADIQTATDPTRAAATNVRLVGLAVVAERTAESLGGGWTTSQIRDAVDASAEGTSDVVSIDATAREPVEASRIANTFAREFIAFRAEADRTKLADAQSLAQQELTRLSPAARLTAGGQALSSAAQRLGILASLQTGNAELVQAADTPTSPSSPRPIRNTLFGLALGLLLGVGLAMLLERMSRPLRNAAEAKAAFELPVVGTVPKSHALAGEAEWLPFGEAESFQTLRGALRYFNLDRDLRSVLVTSSNAGEGKSTVAWNLAMVAASSARTILVEADLRQPTLAITHSLFPTPGLAELLTNQVNLADAIQTLLIEPDADSLHGGGQSHDILVAGSAPPNPALLLEGGGMDELLTRLSRIYEFIVIDTPPVGVVADAFPLLNQVDGVIAVCRIGRTSHDAAGRLREQLRRLGAPVLGVVANGVIQPRRQRRYGYGYYRRRTSGVTSRPDGLQLEDQTAAPMTSAVEHQPVDRDRAAA